MKLARYFGVGTLVAGVAAFTMTGRTDTPLGDPLADSAVTLETESGAAVDSITAKLADIVAPARAPTTTSSATRRGNNRSGGRFRGYRNRNRYPGPIPTHEQWVAPEGPVRIALQAGHWKANEAPPELSGLKDNGTSFEGKPEWEVNLAIVRSTAALLEQKGYLVDILPAVVPPDYRAHLFISIHADGSADTRASGYRVAAPRQDATGRAARMVSLLEESYGKATGIKQLPDVTRRMENYYAFNFRRYEHALHPMTIAVILETGFLTSASDRDVILSDPDRVARGIVDAVVTFPETPAPDSSKMKSGGS